MVEYKAVTSSNIQGIGYDPTTKELFVEFKGRSRYKYSGVQQEDYEDFMSAPSKGSYFADNIKDAYPCQRV